ncbi:MAG: ABC transporter ATP-binding protein [Fervidobacterium sp.]|uniref:ABC transporter ATP-binding protein n=1 Tax=Fervidobacterium sp. TaxID=1871331 RepID=UPI004049CD46
MLLEVRELTKFYGKKIGIENVTFSVDEKEIVGFVGPNGAGKSTTIRTIMGYLIPNAGEIRIFGEKVSKNNLPRLIEMIGYVPGETNYYDDVRVIKILELYKSFYKDFDDKYCEQLCKIFDVPLNKKFEELSLGNKKKVSIIQALAHKPKLLIMDEPTNGLDPFVQKTLYKILLEQKEGGVGIFLSSHVLSEVEKLCDRVIFIKEGHIVTPPKFKKSMKKIVVSLKEVNNIDNIRSKFAGFVEIREGLENGGYIIYFDGNPEKLKELILNLDFSDISVEDLALEDVFEELYKPSQDN